MLEFEFNIDLKIDHEAVPVFQLRPSRSRQFKIEEEKY